MDKIDILLATYNGEKYLSKQLDSILNQTYNNFNLYIIDDDSKDNTFDILKEYESKDRRIKVFKNEKNIGSTATFKLLLQKVTNNIFMLSDQDDVWCNDKIEQTYKKLISSNSDLVFTDLEVVDENLNTISSSFNKLKKYYNKISKFDSIYNNFKMVYLYNVVTGCTLMTKKMYIDDIIKFEGNKDIIHDHFIALIVSLKGKITYLNKPTIKYRQHTNNQIGSKRYTDKFKEFDDIRNHLIDVKISIFNVYVKHQHLFNDEYKILNMKALNYFKSLKNKRYLNLKGIFTFNKIYKHESIFYYLLQFNVLNFPFICRIFYNIKKLLLKNRK